MSFRYLLFLPLATRTLTRFLCCCCLVDQLHECTPQSCSYCVFSNPGVKAYYLTILLNRRRWYRRKGRERRRDLKALLYDPWPPLVRRLLNHTDFCKFQEEQLRQGCFCFCWGYRRACLSKKCEAGSDILKRPMPVNCFLWKDSFKYQHGSGGAPNCSNRAVLLCDEPKLKSFIQPKCL